jgi:HlyD family secretion protein
MKKLILFVILPAVVIGGGLALAVGGGDDPEYRTVRVERGTVVQEAVAVGRIEPEFEVPVKSRGGGVLTRRFVRLGQKVKKEAPLVEVRPVVTDLDMLQAERALQGALDAEQNASELREGDSLMGQAMLLLQGSKTVQRMREGAVRSRSNAEENLELLREGQAEIDGKLIDFLVRAPIEGHVIELSAEVGEPIVPASSYGSGTPLMILADMDHPVFRGTVNEVDVGRLREGMQATLSIGALPGVEVEGELLEISLRSRSVNNATVFDVKLAVTPPPELVLRSGYSAVARVAIKRAEAVLVLPERVVDYRGGSAFVLREQEGEAVEKEIETGLSDGLRVEVLGGLSEGEAVLERVY